MSYGEKSLYPPPPPAEPEQSNGDFVTYFGNYMYHIILQTLPSLRTFAPIVCAQPFCAGNATVLCHASLRLTGPEDKHGVENAGEKKFLTEFTPLDHR